MILSHKHKFIFICNGRTGTTSLRQALLQYDEGRGECFSSPKLWVGRHIPPAVLKSVIPSAMWRQYFKFVFVRHPLDWFVSQFKHNFRPPVFPRRKLWKAPWRAAKLVKSFNYAKRLSDINLFDREEVDFLYAHLKQYRGLPQSETLLQSNYVYDLDGNRVVNFIGKFESIEEDVAKCCEKIGIDFVLQHLNKTVRKPYQQCFTRDGIQRVYDLWSADFDNFDYKKVPAEQITGNAGQPAV